jgi:putative Mg2+ transporter-C (MgtC) family protein
MTIVIGEVTSLALDGDVVARLLVAALLSGLVGMEREATDQPAGLRTHMALGLGAALFGVVSTLGFDEFDQRRANSVLQADVTRVASQVVVGVGFLGAGVIFRQGNAIRNLTTAASLWAVAAIGLACGVGDLGTAGVATVVLLVSLVLLRPIRTLIRTRFGDEKVEVRIVLREGADTGALLAALDRAPEVDMTAVRIDRAEQTVVTAYVQSRDHEALRALVSDTGALPGVESVSSA